jgi:hypothetical protein
VVTTLPPRSPEQEAVLTDLAMLGASPTDIWNGAHFVVDGDGGHFYEAWRPLGAWPRLSSHYPQVDTPQLEIRFDRAGFLFGKNAAGDTWCQMEKTSRIASPLAHFFDFIAYRISGKNVGPLGLSPHTERGGAIHLRDRR